jgi:hypothetical protein
MRKGKYVNETFLRRKDDEEWALDIERLIHRGESVPSNLSRGTKTFDELIQLHREDFKRLASG